MQVLLGKITNFAGRWILVSVVLSLAFGIVTAEEPEYPGYTGYVNDFAGVIPAEEETKMTTLIRAVEKSTTAEIAVATVQTIAPRTIDMYAVELFEHWGIGKKGKDNGVLIVLAMKEKKWRIETGYGLEGALPDIICSKIGNKTMLPYFKKQQFGKGLLAGTVSIAESIGREYNVDLEKVLKETGYQHYTSQGKSPFSTIFTLLLFILLFGMRMGLFGFLFLGRPGYWSGGGHTGTGGFGGGFGGFGGGLSGGGGASGGW